MKNKLAENFLRFAPKNLTESTRSKLVTLIKEGTEQDIISQKQTQMGVLEIYKSGQVGKAFMNFMKQSDNGQAGIMNLGTGPDGNPVFCEFEPGQVENGQGNSTGYFRFYSVQVYNGWPFVMSLGSVIKRNVSNKYNDPRGLGAEEQLVNFGSVEDSAILAYIQQNNGMRKFIGNAWAHQIEGLDANVYEQINKLISSNAEFYKTEFQKVYPLNILPATSSGKNPNDSAEAYNIRFNFSKALNSKTDKGSLLPGTKARAIYNLFGTVYRVQGES